VSCCTLSGAQASDRNLFSLPFKGRVGEGMGYPQGTAILNPIPLPSSPLKGEGISADARA